MDGEIIENDTKTIVWTENILFVFGAKTPFSNLSGLVWMGPKKHREKHSCAKNISENIFPRLITLYENLYTIASYKVVLSSKVVRLDSHVLFVFIGR